jgi:hypothetical protein
VSLHPDCVVTISETVCVPAVLYAVEVFWLVDIAGLPPVIAQFHVVIGSLDMEVLSFVKVVVDPRQGEVLLNRAVGNGLTVAVRIVVFWQLLLDVAVRAMLNIPAEEKVWQGFCKFEILPAEPGSPKFQLQPVIVFGAATEDRSLKQVDTPRQTGVVLKLAAGNGLTTTGRGKESLHPKLFVTTKDAV